MFLDLPNILVTSIVYWILYHNYSKAITWIVYKRTKMRVRNKVREVIWGIKEKIHYKTDFSSTKFE